MRPLYWPRPRVRKATASGRGKGAGGVAAPSGGDAQCGRTSSQAAPVSAWLNRLLILAGAAVVLTAAVQGYMVVQSLPVQRISVTGELEHTQAQAVQDMVQPAWREVSSMLTCSRYAGSWRACPGFTRPGAAQVAQCAGNPCGGATAYCALGRDGFLNHEGGCSTRTDGDWESLPLLDGPEGSALRWWRSTSGWWKFWRHWISAVEQLSVDERGQVEAVLVAGCNWSWEVMIFWSACSAS